MPKPRTFYDTKCADLADAFLEDEPQLNTAANREELAIEIQQTIESYIASKPRTEGSAPCR